MKSNHSKIIIMLLVCVVIFSGIYFYMASFNFKNQRVSSSMPIISIVGNSHSTFSDSSSLDNAITLVNKEPVYIIEGFATKKTSDTNTLLGVQYSVKVYDTKANTPNNLKGKTIIINEPIGVTIGSGMHVFIGIYDVSHDWYDTTKFQSAYTFAGTVLGTSGVKLIEGINVTKYNVNVSKDEPTAYPLTGTLKVNVFNSDSALENNKEYYFYALQDATSKEFVVIYSTPYIIYTDY